MLSLIPGNSRLGAYLLLLPERGNLLDSGGRLFEVGRLIEY